MYKFWEDLLGQSQGHKIPGPVVLYQHLGGRFDTRRQLLAQTFQTHMKSKVMLMAVLLDYGIIIP